MSHQLSHIPMYCLNGIVNSDVNGRLDFHVCIFKPLLNGFLQWLNGVTFFNLIFLLFKNRICFCKWDVLMKWACWFLIHSRKCFDTYINHQNIDQRGILDPIKHLWQRTIAKMINVPLFFNYFRKTLYNRCLLRS